MQANQVALRTCIYTAMQATETCLYTCIGKEGTSTYEADRLHVRGPASPSSDHVNHGPRRPPDHVAIMIAAKNGATTITTAVMVIGRKARGLDNFIANDTSSHLSNIATHRLHPPVVNKAKYYF